MQEFEPLAGVTGTGTSQAAPPHGAPWIVAVCNQKGGVAKTTTCVNLAAGLAEAGARVLVVDLDAQGNATRSLGVTQAVRGAYEFLCGDAGKADAAVESALLGVMVIPATPTLHLSELEPAVAAISTSDLRRRLTADDLPADIILIDCPPTLGVLSINAISAADLILIPVTPTAYGIDALDKTSRTIGELRALSTDTVAVLLTISDAEDQRAVDATEQIRRRYGRLVLPFAIPKDSSHAEAANRNRPLLLLHPETRASTAYWRLTVAVLRLLQPFARPEPEPPVPEPDPEPPPPMMPEPLAPLPPPSFTPRRRRTSASMILAVAVTAVMVGLAIGLVTARLIGDGRTGKSDPWMKQMDEIQR